MSVGYDLFYKIWFSGEGENFRKSSFHLSTPVKYF